MRLALGGRTAGKLLTLRGAAQRQAQNIIGHYKKSS